MTEINRVVGKGRLVRAAGLVAATGAAAGLVGVAAGTADAAPKPPKYSQQTTICSASVADPYTGVPAKTEVSAGQSYRILAGSPYREAPVRGKADFSARSVPALPLSHQQKVVFEWKNLSTGKSGKAEDSVDVTPEGGLTVAKGVPTGAGRIQVTAKITNLAGPAFGSLGADQKGSCSGKTFRVI